MNKKGQGLSITTVIVIILAIAVLAIVLIMLLGGTSMTWTRIKDTLSGTIAGTDMTLAVYNCEQYCEQAKILPETSKKTSIYCTKTFYLDTDGDGKAEKDDKGNYIKYHCSDIDVKCGDICKEEQTEEKEN